MDSINEIKQTCDFICAAANTTSKSIRWISHGSQSIIAFCSNNVVCIADASNMSIVCTLKGHASHINAISYTQCDQGTYIFTAGDDGNIFVWQHSLNASLCEWSLVDKLLSGAHALVSIAVVETSLGAIICSAQSNGLMNIWFRNSSSSTFYLLSKSQLAAAQMPKDLHFRVCDVTDSDFVLLLFAGGVDSRVHVLATTCATLSASSAAEVSLPLPLHQVFSTMGTLSGHEDWVTCLDSHCVASRSNTGSEYFIASGSQDTFIRVWKLTVSAPTGSNSSSISSAAIASLEELAPIDDEEDDTLATSEVCVSFNFQNAEFQLSLEALLVGHEDWVTHVEWINGHTLFTASMDRNMILWSPEAGAGVWVPLIRMGDIGGTLGGSVGGNLLGFVGGCIEPTGLASGLCCGLIGIGYGGSCHLWRCNNNEKDEEAAIRWQPLPSFSGHFSTVNDIKWSSEGDYVISASSDQTTRLFAPILRDCNDSDSSEQAIWKEISRPQIHGYDVNCIVLENSPSHIIFSASSEHIIRVFDAPGGVLDGLKVLCGLTSQDSDTEETNSINRAYIPELGLSNKAADLMTSTEKAEQETRCVNQLMWDSYPLEGQLADHTIWPETNKLYGHSNDVVCLALSPQSSTSGVRYLASACKARDTKTASIFIWDTTTMVSIGQLQAHESTVVCMSFSADARYLASAGKDRMLVIHRMTGDAQEPRTQCPYSLCVGQKSAHKRIIWGCRWTGDSQLLCTVARDGVCKLWRVVEGVSSSISLSCVHNFIPFAGNSITAIDIYPDLLKAQKLSWLVALGSVGGDIQVWSVSVADGEDGGISSRCIHNTPDLWALGDTVQALSWNVHNGPLGQMPSVYDASAAEDAETASRLSLQLACCGGDHSVRVFTYIV